MSEAENQDQSAVSPTAYDDAYKTLLHRCSRLIIPVVNEIFGTKYNKNDRIVFLEGEFQPEKVDGRQDSIRTDSIFDIYSESGKARKYHIECQSTTDNKMIIRMFEYSTQAALLEPTELNDEQMTIKFPQNAILYLRSNSKTPNYMTVNIEVEEKKIPIMQIPVMKAKNYSLEEIFEKDLLFLIPFHLFALENKFEQYEKDEAKFEELCKKYENIADKLNQLVEENKLGGFERTIIYNATKRVAELLAKKHKKILKGVEESMGGKIWETPETKIYDEGTAKGIEIGRAKGHAEGFAEGRASMSAEIENVKREKEEEKERILNILMTEPQNDCEKKYFAIVKHVLQVNNKKYSERSEKLAVKKLLKAGYSEEDILKTLKKFSPIISDETKIRENIREVVEKQKAESAAQ